MFLVDACGRGPSRSRSKAVPYSYALTGQMETQSLWNGATNSSPSGSMVCRQIHPTLYRESTRNSVENANWQQQTDAALSPVRKHVTIRMNIRVLCVNDCMTQRHASQFVGKNVLLDLDKNFTHDIRELLYQCRSLSSLRNQSRHTAWQQCFSTSPSQLCGHLRKYAIW